MFKFRLPMEWRRLCFQPRAYLSVHEGSGPHHTGPRSACIGPPPDIQICSGLTSLCRDPSSSNMFSLVDYVARTVRRVGGWHLTKMSSCFTLLTLKLIGRGKLILRAAVFLWLFWYLGLLYVTI